MNDKKYTEIVVIYNPNSTGSGQAMAHELRDNITTYDVKLVETKYAGHAEKLAYGYAQASARPLVISSSGDGGYHEVVNGLIKAQQEGATPVASLLPAGNANDHFHDVHDIDLVKAINSGKTQTIDLLKLSTTINEQPFERYAHSYIGFGLTPKVGEELNQVNLNWFNQIWIVLKTLFILQPIKIMYNGKRRTYDSLIISNISKMSKVLSLSQNASNQDGKFEVTIFKRRNKFRLIKLLLKASTSGMVGEAKADNYEFNTIKELLVQMDGEIATVDANAKVLITIENKALECVI